MFPNTCIVPYHSVQRQIMNTSPSTQSNYIAWTWGKKYTTMPFCLSVALILYNLQDKRWMQLLSVPIAAVTHTVSRSYRPRQQQLAGHCQCQMRQQNAVCSCMAKSMLSWPPDRQGKAAFVRDTGRYDPRDTTEEDHGMIYVETHLENHLVPTSLQWGCSKPHLTWLWTLPGIELPQLLCSSVSPLSLKRASPALL